MLRELRESNKLTREELAWKSGISKHTIQSIEQNKTSIAKAEALTIVKLAKSLGTTSEELLKDFM